MTFNPDDPKWTAYVLGELVDSERAEIDSLLESSEEARAFVDELRVATGALEHELKMVELKVGLPPEINAGLPPGLTDAQRAAIQAAAGATNNIRWFRQPTAHQAWLGGLAIAAMILLAVAIPSLWRSQKTDGTANARLSATAMKSEESSQSLAAPVPGQGNSQPSASYDTKASKNGERSEESRDSAEQTSKLANGTAAIPQPGEAESGKNT